MRTLCGYLLGLVLLAGSATPASAALAVEASGGSDTSASATVNVTGFTVTSANLIVCGVAYVDGGVQPTGVAWDPAGVNQAFTQLIRERESVNTGYAVDLWYRKSPTAGSSKTITATLNGSSSNLSMVCISFTDAHLTTTFGTAVSADSEAGASDPITVTAGTAAGEIVFDMAMAQVTTNVGANQTQVFNSVATGQFFGGSYQDGSNGGVMSWDKDGGGTQHWVTAAVSIKPSGGGGGGAGTATNLLILGVGGDECGGS